MNIWRENIPRREVKLQRPWDENMPVVLEKCKEASGEEGVRERVI